MTPSEIKILLKTLEKHLEVGYGRPCYELKFTHKTGGFNYNCSACQVWMALQILEDHLLQEDGKE